MPFAWKKILKKNNKTVKIPPERMPKHIAIIMDGNGRWAAQRGLPRTAGHHAGMAALRRTIRAANDLGIKVLTVYAFSTENWNRPAAEVDKILAEKEKEVMEV